MKKMIFGFAFLLCYCSDNKKNPEYTVRQFINSLSKDDFITAQLYAHKSMVDFTVILQKNKKEQNTSNKVNSFDSNFECTCEIYHSKASCTTTNKISAKEYFTLVQEEGVWLITSSSLFTQNPLGDTTTSVNNNWSYAYVI